MNILHRNLETIETTGLRPLYIIGEIGGQILINNTITCCKECQHMLNEVTFVGRESLKLSPILRQVDLLRLPERTFCLLVHIVYILVFDGEESEPVRIGL